MRCTVLCVLEPQNNLAGSCFEVVTGLSASDRAASYRPCQSAPHHGKPRLTLPNHMALPHRNDHSTNGHYADQQPLPRQAQPRHSAPHPAAPRPGGFHTAIPTVANRHYAIQPLPSRTGPRLALPSPAKPCRMVTTVTAEPPHRSGSTLLAAHAEPRYASPRLAVPLHAAW